MAILSKMIYTFNAMSIKILMASFSEIEKKKSYLKICMEL